MQSEKIDLLLGLGPQFVYYPNDITTGLFEISLEGSSIKYGYTEYGTSGKKDLHAGLLLNAALNIKTKYLAICPYVQYYYQPGYLYKITVATENLESSNTITDHTVKSSYLGFGVNLYPAKAIFRKSKR